MLSVFHIAETELGNVTSKKHVHIVYIEICGNLSFEVEVVKKISVRLNSEKFRANK